MKKAQRFLWILLMVAGIGSTLSAQENKQFNALLVSKTAGWHHESINEGVAAIKALANKHFFEVQWHQEATPITDEYLKKFQVIIFLNTTGDILKDNEQKAVERFIESGKGFVGIHSASDTEYGWDWYTKMVGRMFHIHPVIQTARLKLTDKTFPGLQGFANDPWWTDEWYEFQPETIHDLNYILAVDETSYNPKVQWGPKIGKGMGAFHPIAWYHNYDGGRAFYTALGHQPTDYSDPAFLNHIYAGIFWAATGRK
ncbi:MAG: ThuA domain-containing protein [Bacteroidota bacterium]|nr:ThuA domain-containing protein [Bacteroidota bacterium]